MNNPRRSRAGRALLWILLIIVVLIVLSLLFGGFQKGTKAAPTALKYSKLCPILGDSIFRW